MKKNYSLIISIIACLLVVVCLFQINGLKNQIAYLESSLNSRISNVESNQDSIYSNVEQRLEEHVSLLTDYDWSYGDYNISDGTVQLHCSVTPKEYSPEVTKAMITINGISHEMTANSGEFILETKIPLFDDTEVSKVVFTENENARAEALDWYISPRTDYIPVVTTDIIDGSGHGNPSYKKADTYIWHYEGEYDIFADCPTRPFDVVSIALVEKIDGTVTSQTDIPINTDDEMVPDIQMDDNNSFYHYYQFEKDFEIPFGSTMELYVELIDSDGFVHRCLIERWKISDDGELADGFWDDIGLEASIYDKNGKTLFIPENY